MTKQQPPSYAALRRHHKRIQGMLDDPQCVGDLLALGVAIARYVDFDPDWLNREVEKPKRSIVGIARDGLEPSRAGFAWHVKNVLRKDIRRYDMLAGSRGYDRPCGAPMIRRSGTCNQRSTNMSEPLVDLDTGKVEWFSACGRREHKAWLAELERRNRAARKDTPPPAPTANAGGVLERHFPEIGWNSVYRGIDPRWTAPPEDGPWRKPQFELVLGDSDDDAGPAVSDRPALAVVNGAGERINIDEPGEADRS